MKPSKGGLAMLLGPHADGDGADSEGSADHGSDFESAILDAFPDLQPEQIQSLKQAIQSCIDEYS